MCISFSHSGDYRGEVSPCAFERDWIASDTRDISTLGRFSLLYYTYSPNVPQVSRSQWAAISVRSIAGIVSNNTPARSAAGSCQFLQFVVDQPTLSGSERKFVEIRRPLSIVNASAWLLSKYSSKYGSGIASYFLSLAAFI